MAVAAQQEGIDPVGSCVGLRGVRIQNVVNELGGERIDVIQWHAHPKVFIANALSPAQVMGVDISEAEKSAVVVVPDGQLSLAIGKEGQNARLAAKLTGWKIDIKSASVAEVERKALVKEKAPVPALAEGPVKLEEPVTPVAEVAAVSDVLPQVEEAPEVELPEKVEEEEVEELVPYQPPSEVEVSVGKRQIRFAEDIFAGKDLRGEGRKKDKKKKTAKEDKLEEGKVWFTQRDTTFISMYVEAIRNCEKEVLIASTSPTPPEKEILEAVRHALKKGKSVRVVRQITEGWTLKDLEDYERYIKAGSQVRYLDIKEIPLRFMIFDDRDVILVFPSEKGSTALEALWLRIPPLARILHQQFEELWKKGTPILPVLNEIKQKKRASEEPKKRQREA